MTDAMTDAVVWTREQLTPGRRDEVAFRISASDMDAFAEVSGDRNPLHVSDEFARARGFRGRVVYGALLTAKVSQLIGMRLPGRDSVWASVALRFHEPLYLDEAATADAEVVSVSLSTGLVELRLSVRSGERLLAKGKAEVIVGHR